MAIIDVETILEIMFRKDPAAPQLGELEIEFVTITSAAFLKAARGSNLVPFTMEQMKIASDVRPWKDVAEELRQMGLPELSISRFGNALKRCAHPLMEADRRCGSAGTVLHGFSPYLNRNIPSITESDDAPFGLIREDGTKVSMYLEEAIKLRVSVILYSAISSCPEDFTVPDVVMDELSHNGQT